MIFNWSGSSRFTIANYLRSLFPILAFLFSVPLHNRFLETALISSLFEVSTIEPTTRFELPVERLGKSLIEIINKVSNFLLKLLNRGKIAPF